MVDKIMFKIVWRTLSPEALKFQSTAELEPLEGIVGQARGINK